MSFHHIPHAKTVATVAKLVWQHATFGMIGDSKDMRPTRTQIEETAIRLQDALVAAIEQVGHGARIGRATAPILAFYRYKFGQINEMEADKFFKDLAEGAGLDRGDPVLALRSRLFEGVSWSRTGAKALSMGDTAELFVRAWNHRRQGNRVNQIKRGDVFPLPI